MLFYCLVVGIFGMYFAYKRKFIPSRCEDVLKLYNTVHEINNHSRFKSMCLCVSMIVRMMYTKMILGRLEATRVNKNTYEVSYYIGNRGYKMHMSPITGPSVVMKVKNEDDTDITDIVLQYYGPEQNWHGKNFPPSFFGCNKLIFESFDGTEKIEL